MTGESTDIFNGICGAESGWIPVSAAAPAMLFSEIEVQKRGHSLTPMPALPKPSQNPNGPASDTFSPAPDKEKDTDQPQ